MNRKTWIVGIIAFFLIGASIVYAYQHYTLTETATIEGVGSLIEIKGQDATKWIPLGETDTIDWGTVEPDTTYIYDIRITNIGSVVFTVSFMTDVDTNYPGWTETLSIDGTSIGLTMVETGTLTLVVPVGAIGSVYTWNSQIDCTEVT